MIGYSICTPAERAAWFTRMAESEICFAQEGLADAGLFHGEIGVHGYQRDAIDRFAEIAFLNERDDDEAVIAAQHFLCTLSYSDKGAIPHFLLYHHALGVRVRSAILKHAWTEGRSGSVLALNGPSKTLLCEYFREADRAELMDEVDLKAYEALGETVRVYRGAKLKDGCPMRTAFALSWTLDYETARWFGVHGHGKGPGVVLAADIPRSSILALWEESGREPEVIVNPRRLRNVRIVERIDPDEERAAWNLPAARAA
jgi:hypothetical protein